MAGRIVPQGYKKAYACFYDGAPLFVFQNRQGHRMIRLYLKGESGYRKAAIVARTWRPPNHDHLFYRLYIAKEMWKYDPAKIERLPESAAEYARNMGTLAETLVTIGY